MVAISLRTVVWAVLAALALDVYDRPVAEFVLPDFDVPLGLEIPSSSSSRSGA
jgi:hypothetical protein